MFFDVCCCVLFWCYVCLVIVVRCCSLLFVVDGCCLPWFMAVVYLSLCMVDCRCSLLIAVRCYWLLMVLRVVVSCC